MTLQSLPKEIILLILNNNDISPVITRLVCKKWSLWIKPIQQCEKKVLLYNQIYYGLNIVKWLNNMKYPIDKQVLEIAILNNNLNLVKWLYTINPRIEDPFNSAYSAELRNKPEIQEYLWNLCVFYES